MKKCPKCQTTYSDEEKFCPNCGTALETAEEPQAAQPQSAPAEASPAKKSKLPLILALCAVLVLGVVLGLLVAGGFGGREDTKQETEAKTSDSAKKKKKAAENLKDKIDGDKDSKKEEKKAEGENFYQAKWCSFSYPEEWVGKVRIEENVYEKIRSISICMDEKNDYGSYPLLYAIELSDYPYVEDPPTDSDEYYYNPGYKETLGVSTTGVYAHLVGPTDVQFDPDQQAEYQKLYEANLSIIRDTFKFDY